jgi:glycylpeptide N-tetradecanoyltransferase
MMQLAQENPMGIGTSTVKHEFWDTQPVPPMNDETTLSKTKIKAGPIDPEKTVDEIRADPYDLPAAFEWVTCDINDEQTVNNIYVLLNEHYVEDSDAMFRFDYKKEFLRWALLPPGQPDDWHIGVAVKATGKLVGFITAVPAEIRTVDRVLAIVEINFLCVHKKLRSKRLAPLLIKEITRRVNRRNIWQAVYTAGVVIPSPVGSARYYHRSLNPKKLISIGFSHLPARMRLEDYCKRHYLPPAVHHPLRPMEQKDVARVHALMKKELNNYPLAARWTQEEAAHYLLPRDQIVYTYVLETSGTVTDFISFYVLPSTVVQHPTIKDLNAVYLYYYAAKSIPLPELMKDCLILARNAGFDVFNCLDIMQNTPELLRDLQFGEGDGILNYYMFNWRAKKEASSAIGIVLP